MGIKKITKSQKRLIDKFKKLKKDYSHYRALIGQQLPLEKLGEVLGSNSLPGSSITFTPSNHINTSLVNLGCIDGNSFQDVQSVNIEWPIYQTPDNFSTGTSISYQSINNGISVSEQFPLTGGAYPTTVNIPNNESITNRLAEGSSTPFQSTIQASSIMDIYKSYYVGNNYSSVNLSQEGLLWTLWPLAKPKKETVISKKENILNGLGKFATSTTSNYAIGQMGFFINNTNQGCTVLGGQIPTAYDNNIFAGINPIDNNFIFNDEIYLGGLNGVQELGVTLLLSTKQLLSIVVIKVSEEIARIINPAAGISNDDRFLYVGYDGWAIIRTTANPISPMAASTYLSPQTITGNITKENMQVIFPPNFPYNVLYKNMARTVPSVEPIYSNFSL